MRSHRTDKDMRDVCSASIVMGKARKQRNEKDVEC